MPTLLRDILGLALVLSLLVWPMQVAATPFAGAAPEQALAPAERAALAPNTEALDAALSATPLLFIENWDQHDARARLQVRGGGGTLWLADDSILVSRPNAASLDDTTADLVAQIGGISDAVAVENATAYLGVGPRIVVLDVSDPSDIVVLGQSEVFPSIVGSVGVAGPYLYATLGDDGLRVIDVSDPANLQVLGSWDASETLHRVAADENYAYAVTSNSIWIINVSDPTNPYAVGSSAITGNIRALAVDNGHAYIAARHGGLQVVDLSDPASPQVVGSYTDAQGYDVADVAVSGRYAYVAASGGGLHVVDISNPASPRLVSSQKDGTAGDYTNIAVLGQYVYVGALYGLRVINVADPTDPQRRGFSAALSGRLVVAGQYAYVARGHGGGNLVIVDVSEPNDPVEVGFYQVVGRPAGVAVHREHAFLVEPNGSLRVVYVPLAANPQEVGSLAISRLGSSVDVQGNYIYVAAGDGLNVVDISNPKAPYEVGSCYTAQKPTSVAVDGGYAFATAGYHGLRVVNVSDAANPHVIGFCFAPEMYAHDVAVNGSYAYVATSGGLWVVDVSDPTDPQIVGSLDTPGYHAYGVALADEHAYTMGSDGLRAIDVSDPHNPRLVGSCERLGNGRCVAVVGHRAYIAASGSLWIVDISVPAEPYLVGSRNTARHAAAVVVAGGHAYVGAGSAGLFVFRLYQPGDLTVTKVVDWSGITPDEGQVFTVTIAGPSYPEGDAKMVGYQGGSATWSDLEPGTYLVSEVDPGEGWEMAGSGVEVAVSGGVSATATITNTYQPGDLTVTKVVDWSGITPDERQVFTVTIAGSSYPEGDAKTVGYQGGAATWSDLEPGTYLVSEVDPGEGWQVAGSGVEVAVSGGVSATTTITNTYRMAVYLPLIIR